MRGNDLIASVNLQRAAHELHAGGTVEYWKSTPYFTNFWTPLPKHRLGKYTAEDLAQSEEARRYPLGWGPYLLQEWVPGDHLTLARNPYYFRGGQGLPRFEYLVFRFLGQDAASAVDALVAGECDVLDASIPLDNQFEALKALADAGKITLYTAPMATTEEFLYFGIHPAAYDNGWQRGDRPEILSNPQVRQALAMCINRQALIDDLYHGLAETSATYLPPQHPLYNQDAQAYPYDPQQAQALLEAAGWVDHDGDPTTPRLYRGPEQPYYITQDTPLVLRYLTDTAPFRQQAAQRIAKDLQACGVGVEVETLPPEQLYQPGPDGPLFGRQFDLAQTAFATGGEPPCLLWTSSFTPGDPNATRGDIAWIRISKAAMGEFPGGNYVGDVGLAPFHDFDSKIPAELKTKLEETKKGLLDGSISTGYNPGG